MASILVTGGAGYVGSHTVRALVRAGYDVVVYDDLSQGHREAVGGAELVTGDVRDTAAVGAALREFRVSAVVHCAGRLSVPESVQDPAGYYRSNVEGALSVLQAMADTAVSRFVFSSTCAVYGEPIGTPITEDHPTSPINPYGETKLAVERALPHVERAYGIRFVCLRYFNAAGADPAGDIGEDHRPEIHAIPRALAAACGGPPFQVYGDDYATPDGTCLRDYVHVSDLADVHVRAVRALERASASATYNVGTGRPYSVREVLAAVERVTGRRVAHAIGPRRAGDPAVLYAGTERVRAALAWQPRYVELDPIVRTAWDWHARHPRGFSGAA